jgi:hypothetical protein
LPEPCPHFSGKNRLKGLEPTREKHKKRENAVPDEQFDFTIKVRHQRKLISRKRTGNTGGQMNQNEHAREIKLQALSQKGEQP